MLNRSDNPGISPISADRPDVAADRRAVRRAMRRERSGGAWLGGVALILLGVLFLLQNLGTVAMGRWWALLILLPAASAFITAWQGYRDAGGHLTASARGSLIGGAVLTIVTLVIVFDLNWGIYGPLLLILAGLAVVLSAFSKSDTA